MYVNGRRYDTLRDLAACYARLGDKEKALSLLESMQQEAWIPAVTKDLSDPKFASVQQEPRFLALLATFKATDRLWEVPSIATGYQDSLSVEERIAGLSLFWAEARQNFVYL